MTAPNPLVAEAENEDAEPADNWEGAGAASSIADMNEAWASDHPDPIEIAFSTAAAGLDTLAAVEDPFGSLLAAGIGWLIEHVWFLHEPLDALAGDPTQITAQAQTWHNVGSALRSVATEHRTAAALPEWQGDAADAYRRSVEAFAGALTTTATDAERLSNLILATGAGVGTERALIRDEIAEFVALVVEYFFWSAALSLLTAGGALGAFVVSVVVRAVELARSISRGVSALLDALHAAGGTAAQLSEAMRDTAAQVRVIVPEVHAQAKEIAEGVEEMLPGPTIEAAKQGTSAKQDQLDWEEPALPG